MENKITKAQVKDWIKIINRLSYIAYMLGSDKLIGKVPEKDLEEMSEWLSIYASTINSFHHYLHRILNETLTPSDYEDCERKLDRYTSSYNTAFEECDLILEKHEVNIEEFLDDYAKFMAEEVQKVMELDEKNGGVVEDYIHQAKDIIKNTAKSRT